MRPLSSRSHAARRRTSKGGDPMRLYTAIGNYRSVLRRVDQHIAEADDDPSLQSF